MTKLEEIARALCKAEGHDPDEISLGYAYGQPEYGAKGTVRVRAPSMPQWTRYLFEARIAVEAMREPSEAMYQAGRIPQWDKDGYKGPEEVWHDMIDAILNESLRDQP